MVSILPYSITMDHCTKPFIEGMRSYLEFSNDIVAEFLVNNVNLIVQRKDRARRCPLTKRQLDIASKHFELDVILTDYINFCRAAMAGQSLWFDLDGDVKMYFDYTKGGLVLKDAA